MPKSIIQLLNEKKDKETKIYSNESVFRSVLDSCMSGCLNIISSIRSIKSITDETPSGIEIDTFKNYMKDIRKYRDEPTEENNKWDNDSVQKNVETIQKAIESASKELEKLEKDILNGTSDSPDLRIPNEYYETAASLQKKADQKILSLAKLESTKKEVDKYNADVDPITSPSYQGDKINIVGKKGGNDNKSPEELENDISNGIYGFLSTITGDTMEVVKAKYEKKDKSIYGIAVKKLESIFAKKYSVGKEIEKGKNPFENKEFLNDFKIWIGYNPKYKNYKSDDKPEDKIEDKSISDNDKKKIKTKTDVIIGEIKKSIEAIITDNSGDGFKQKSLKAKMEEAKKEIEELVKNGSENSCDLDSIDKLVSFDDDIEKKIEQYKNILSKNDINNLKNISKNIKSIINYCREEQYKS
jgi:hypothetical protein